MLARIVLLVSLSWIMRLTTPLFTAFRQEISGRDLILILGGLFLLIKSTREIHDRLERASGESGRGQGYEFVKGQELWPCFENCL